MRLLTAALLLIAPLGCGDSAAGSPDAVSPSDGAALDTALGDTASADTASPPPDTPVSDQPGARALTLMAAREALPGIADQPTDRGRRIGAVHGFDGRVFFGYGDYSGNTGPIAVLTLDPATDLFAADPILPTEEVGRFFEHQGQLFVADLDPDGHQDDGSVYRLAHSGATWAKMTPIPGAVHTFWLASRGDQLFAVTGSVTAATARLSVTTDLGQTWTDLHTTLSGAGVFSRYTSVMATPDALFVAGFTTTEPRTRLAWVRRQDTWSPVAGAPRNGDLLPMQLGGEALLLHFSGDVGKGGTHVGTFALAQDTLNPVTPFPAGDRVVNWDTRDGRLWVLFRSQDGRRVAFADTPWDFQPVLTLPADIAFSALGYHNNRLYLGTEQGDIYQVDEVWKPL